MSEDIQGSSWTPPHSPAINENMISVGESGKLTKLLSLYLVMA